MDNVLGGFHAIHNRPRVLTHSDHDQRPLRAAAIREYRMTDASPTPSHRLSLNSNRQTVGPPFKGLPCRFGTGLMARPIPQVFGSDGKF
jgi:hypothetical protein